MDSKAVSANVTLPKPGDSDHWPTSGTITTDANIDDAVRLAIRDRHNAFGANLQRVEHRDHHVDDLLRRELVHDQLQDQSRRRVGAGLHLTALLVA
jgi:hypothetical protein